MNSQPALDPAVLGRILLLQSTLPAASDENRLMEMIVRELATLPGVADCVACIEGATTKILAPCDPPIFVDCPAASDDAPASFVGCPDACPFASGEHWQRIELRTPRREYGTLFFKVRDQASFAPYLPFTENTANLVTLLIQNNRTAAERNLLDRGLDEQVRERTEQLRESEIRLRETQRVAHIGSFESDIHGNDIWWSDELFHLFGLDPAHFTPTRDGLLELLHPDDRSEYIATLTRSLASGVCLKREYRARHASGEWRHFELVAAATLDDEGEVSGLRGTVQDITDRKQAVEAIENRIVALTRPLEDDDSVMFEDLFNLDDIQRLQDEFAKATGVASLITRTDGTPITAPSNFCRLCSDIIRKTDKGCANCFRSDAAIGRFNSDGPIIQPCMSGGLWDAGAAISVGGRHIANWLVGQVRDDTQTETQMRVYAREIEADEEAVVEAFREVPAMSREQFGQVAQVLFTLANQLSTTAYQNVQQARFITERKHAEEEREELIVKLEAQNAELERFMYTASHDLKAPLITIRGYLGLLTEDIAKGEAEAIEDDTARIVNATDTMAQLLKELVELAKIGRVVNASEEMPLKDLVEEALGLVREHIRQGGVRVEVAPDLPVVFGDRLRLMEVLQNLIDNAVKYMGDQLRPRIDIGGQVCDEGTVCYVRDNGIGIDRRFRGKVFELFHQLDQRMDGSGIGLALVKRIIEVHGGRIWVESHGTGHGTAVYFSLPQKKKPAETEETVTLLAARSEAAAHRR